MADNLFTKFTSDGKKIEIYYDENNDLFDVDLDSREIASVKKLDELNSLLSEHGAETIPTIVPTMNYEGEWCTLHEIEKDVSFECKCYARYLDKTFTIVSIHELEYGVEDMQDEIVVTVDFFSECNLESLNAWTDMMDTITCTRDTLVTEPFTILSLIINGYSLNSRDERVDLTQEDIDRGSYKSFDSILKIQRYFRNKYNLNLSEGDFIEKL